MHVQGREKRERARDYKRARASDKEREREREEAEGQIMMLTTSLHVTSTLLLCICELFSLYPTNHTTMQDACAPSTLPIACTPGSAGFPVGWLAPAFLTCEGVVQRLLHPG